MDFSQYNTSLHTITQDSKGIYHWNGTIDVRYEHKVFKILFSVMGTLCAVFIGMALYLNPRMLGVVLLTCFVIMAIVGGVCWFFNLNVGYRQQPYMMNDMYIIFGGGSRGDSPYFFKDIRKAVIYPSRFMIELFPLIGSGPVFAPPEDYEFVKEYILDHIPREADVYDGER